MRSAEPFDLPPEKQAVYQRAQRLERWMIAYSLSAIAIIYATLGSSQAMKTAWIEDMLSLLPPMAFLIAGRISRRHPTREYPYGYHRATTIAYLVAAMALFALGLYLFVDALSKLALGERSTIGSVVVWGRCIWLGWLMVPALLWSAIPVLLFGRAKRPLAEALHDKVLYADAAMNQAEWLSTSAALLGVVGIGMGFWWADAAAAAIISLDITHDGFRHLKTAVGDLMDRAPRTVDSKQLEALPGLLEEAVRAVPWVADARARVREDGHVYFADVRLVVREGQSHDFAEQLERTSDSLRRLDWRLHEVLLVPVTQL